MDSYKRLLLANLAWVQERLRIHPDYFAKHVETQSPEFLWIGCSDSRVPAEEITGVEPGELFVHRNVANIVSDVDINMLSVLQYAVEVLSVKQVILCGHYNCGGIKSAMTTHPPGPIGDWLTRIRDLYRIHKDQINSTDDLQSRWDRLVDLNVREQVRSLANTSIIQRAWKVNQYPLLHGWVYDLRNGLLKELELIGPTFNKGLTAGSIDNQARECA